MVMIALAILTVMTADFMESNETRLMTAVNHRDAVQAEYLARSGINLSRLLLSVQSMPGFEKAMNFPFWEYADMMLEPFASSEGAGMMEELLGVSMADTTGLGLPEGHEFSVTIVDEESKININMGADATREERRLTLVQNLSTLMEPEMYDDVFKGKDYRDEVEREDVVKEMVDFIDGDADQFLEASGEEDYYSSLEPEYRRKNAPFDSLQELHLVHGVGDDFWSAFVEPDAEDPKSRVLTVWGNARINVNTAPAAVLLSSLCMLAIDEQGNNPCMDLNTRENLANILQAHLVLRTLLPVSNVKEFMQRVNGGDPLMLLIDPSIVPFPVQGNRASELFMTKSQVFSIYAEGTVGNVTRRIHAVVDTEPKIADIIDPTQSLTAAGGRILYWRQE